VRASGAEIGDAHRHVSGRAQHLLSLFEDAELVAEIIVGRKPDQAFANRNGDLVGVQRGLRRKQDLTLLIRLADDRGRVGRTVENILDLRFDYAPLFLHDDDQVEALGEPPYAVRLQGPGNSDLVLAQSQIGAAHFVEPERVQPLLHVEPALAAGDDADLRCRTAGMHDPVETVGA